MEVLRPADAIARHRSATLTVLHVVEPARADLREGSAPQRAIEDVILSEARSELGILTSRLGAQVSPDALPVEAGSPHDRILSASKDVEADLIVIGANNRQSLRDKLLGGTADRMVRSAHISLLMVQRPFERMYREIVAAIDLAAGYDHVAEAARAICSHCAVNLVHVVDVPLSFEQALLRSGLGAADLPRERARLKNYALAQIDTVAWRVSGSTSARTEVIVGEAAISLLKISRRRGLDLMVIGREERGMIERVLLGIRGGGTPNGLVQASDASSRG